MSAGPLVFLVAAEASADAIGARLMAALKTATDGRVRFAGIGGTAMAEEGLESLVHFGELNVMGIIEVLPHVPRILRHIGETAKAALDLRPDAVVTIDAPSFSFRLGRKLRGKGLLLVHYVAPTVWAWRPRRARMIARFLDHLLCVLPFELPYFEKVGLPASFVGHSVIEQDGISPDGPGFRRRHGIADDAPLLCVLPGSRVGEVNRLAPVFGAVVARLAAKHEGLRVVVPTVAPVAALVRSQAAQWRVQPVVVEGTAEKHHAFAASTAALAASGTVNLELAVAGVAFVIAYRVTWLSYGIGRLLVKVPSIVMTNLLVGRNVIPEFLQQDCRADLIAPVVERLLTSLEAREEQRAGSHEAAFRLGLGGPSPSRNAAKIILDLIAGRAKLAPIPPT
ncbi:MAG: lipid-A-disaccharide synthase [Proteobacteria bacterium]|nr:lipid-A-disaccharide synthase [Pseudomonadota bacterium]MBI3496892.1 lipid-A-disaccharide synthase [Pseudomonadota bacterium]